MNKSKALPLVTIISMIIAALVLSASGDITSSSSINNGGRVLSLHTAAIAKVYAIKTQSNSFKELQISPRFVKRNNETSQELVGTQTRHARYSTLPTRKVDEESSFNSSLVNASMPLSSSLLTLMKIGFNNSNYNNHGGNFSTNNNTSSSSSSSTQPSNRIVRREIMSQTQLAGETTQKRGGVSSEKGPRIALIKPSFTAAAYANGFYKFYKLYNSTPVGKNVTTDLNLLSVSVNASWYQSLPYVFSMLKLLNDIKSVTPDSNIIIYDDAFDLVILGHQEYVTQKEYDNLKRFVANGGTMLLLDGNVFYAEVNYDHVNDIVSLVKGHYWAVNGRTAWKSVAERWKNETSQWVGSNYLCYKCVKSFQNNPFGYKPHEEQYLDNPHDVVLFNYNASIPRTYFPVLSSSASLGQVSTKPIIATYELDYKRGRVITLGIYSDDIVTNNKFDNYFEKLLLKQGITDITD
jgi:hypothetical protein